MSLSVPCFCASRGRARGDGSVWLVALAAGSLASLVLYTLSTQGLPMALQGRYLIGWYLTFLAVVGTALALDHRSPSRAGADPRPVRRAGEPHFSSPSPAPSTSTA